MCNIRSSGREIFYTTFLLFCFPQEWSIDPVIPFKPVIEKGDDAFLPANPLELLRNHSAVPWMTGITSEEGALAASSEKLPSLSLTYSGREHRQTVFENKVMTRICGLTTE
jgi:hypothetical protein